VTYDCQFITVPNLFEIAWEDRGGRHLHSDGVVCANNDEWPARARVFCEHTTFADLARYRAVAS